MRLFLFKYSIFIWVLLLYSCSLQKRLYNKGFYTSHNQSVKKAEPTSKADTLPNIAINNLKSKSNSANLIASNSTFLILNFKPVSGCDTIFLVKGGKIVGTVTEINPTHIKFKNCGAINEGELSIKKETVSQIHFANGTKDVFEAERKYNEPNNLPSEKYSNQNKYDRKERKPKGTKNVNAIVGHIVSLVSLPVSGIASLASLLASPHNTGGRAMTYPAQYPNYAKIYAFPLILVLIGLTFCIVGIIRYNRNKEDKKALKLVIMGIVFCILSIGLMALSFIISSM